MNPTAKLQVRHQRYPKIAMARLFAMVPVWFLYRCLAAAVGVTRETYGIYRLLRIQIRLNRRRGR